MIYYNGTFVMINKESKTDIRKIFYEETLEKFNLGEIKSLYRVSGNCTCRETLLHQILTNNFISRHSPVVVNDKYKFLIGIKVTTNEGKDFWKIISDRKDEEFLEILMSKTVFNGTPICINKDIGIVFQISPDFNKYGVKGLEWRLSLTLLILKYPTLFIKPILELKNNEEFIQSLQEDTKENIFKRKEILALTMLRAIYILKDMPDNSYIDKDSIHNSTITRESIIYTAIAIIFGEDFPKLSHNGVLTHGYHIRNKDKLNYLNKFDFIKDEYYNVVWRRIYFLCEK
jgi:hypothetical protein